MDVHLYAWIITVGVMVLILAFDIFIIGRRPHEPSMREAGTAIGIYVGLAVVFGFAVWASPGRSSRPSSSPAGSPSTACRSTTCSSS